VREGRKLGSERAERASEEVCGAVWEGIGCLLPGGEGSSGREDGGEASGWEDGRADSEGMVVVGMICGA